MRTTLGMLAVVAVMGGCSERGSTPAPRMEAPVATASPAVDSGTPAAEAGTSEESCVDAWLAKQKLDSYGSPEGTMYAGGSPLFDERTGQSTPRLDFVYARQPEAKKACHPAP